MSACPVCQRNQATCSKSPGGRDGDSYECPNCGKYFLTRTADALLKSLDKRARAYLSYAIWLHHEDKDPFEIDSGLLRETENQPLSHPTELLDRYVEYIGDAQGDSLGKMIRQDPSVMTAKLGVISKDDVFFINQAAETDGLTEPPNAIGFCGGKLTLRGWQRHRELQTGKTSSRTAFMAMSFRKGQEDVREIVNSHFRDAVKETGFTLKCLDDDPPAGLIDNRLRVEIRTCRFLIADLTYDNSGAYWEAGLAEGFGKPVVFTCKESYFEEKKTHFDVNHHQTIRWDPDNPTKATDELKAMIRSTLPLEAILPTD